MQKLLAFLGFLLLALSCEVGRNPVSLSKMVGGEEVKEGSPAFVSTVSLAKVVKNGFDSFCSGTLIAPNLVLTAAHCVEGFKNSKQFVVLFARSETDPQAVTRSVAAFESYRPRDGSRYFPNFDIAWVKLESEAPAPYRSAEILRSAEQLEPLKNQTDGLLLAGYGRTQTSCAPDQADCSGVRLEVRTYLRRFIRTAHIVELMVIGPKPLFGSCNGDSGGSAFASIKGRWYVLGNLNGKSLSLNTSAVWDSARTCESGESIYTFAGAYVDWIQKSSGVVLSFHDSLNPKGSSMMPSEDPLVLGPQSDLAAMLGYFNPDDPLWTTSEALLASFGEESKRAIAELGDVVTDAARAAAAMAGWDSFKFTGVGFDLSSFALKDRQLSDLRPLAHLRNLQKLELIGNRLVETSPLGQLKNLQELTLSNNYDFETKAKIPYDFTFLSQLSRLRVLNLPSNSGNLDLRKIPWAQLENLETLNMNANDTVSLDQIPFALLPKLSVLSVANSGITDITALEHAKALKTINLRNNSIQDISVLAKLSLVEMLDLTQNQIEDFSALAALKELKGLKALANPQKIKACPDGATCLYTPEAMPAFSDYCEFSQSLADEDRALWPASKTVVLLLRDAGQPDLLTADCAAASRILQSKKKLELSGLKSALWIADLSPLMPLTQLEELTLDHQNFQDLAPLQALTQLKFLNLASNRLTQVNGLAGMLHLRRLILDGNQLKDISALSGIRGLSISALGNPHLPRTCPIPEGQCTFEASGAP